MAARVGVHAMPGNASARGFLRVGFSALGGLGMADLLRLQSVAATRQQAGRGATEVDRNEKAVIVIWLWGGPSHMETFDLKPEAPAEFRGEFRPISTRASGLEICEHLPRLAQMGDRLAILRSLGHDSPGHVSSTHTVLTGYPGEVAEMPPYRPRYPDFWSVVSKMRGERVFGVPVHVALPSLRYNGSAYLPGGLDPFLVSGDPNAAHFEIPDLALERLSQVRFRDRIDLLKQFDRFRQSIDERASDSIDAFNQKAASLLTRGEVRRAFDDRHEDPKTRERYGRHAVGQRVCWRGAWCEAGVRMVTVDFPHVPGQKAFSWDDHASVWNIFTEMKQRLPVLDQVTSALDRRLARSGPRQGRPRRRHGRDVPHAPIKQFSRPAGTGALGSDDVGFTGRRGFADGTGGRCHQSPGRRGDLASAQAKRPARHALLVFRHPAPRRRLPIAPAGRPASFQKASRSPNWAEFRAPINRAARARACGGFQS